MKRPQKIRKQRDTILILTNGRTEKNYFEAISTGYSSMYKIEVKLLNAECDKLVNYAINLDRSKYNQIWCVFDIDNSLEENHLILALKLAKDNNINIAYSNEAFEVWLLYHIFEKVPSALTRKAYIKEINKHLESIGSSKYQKNDVELLKKIFLPKLLVATENSKKVHQKFEAEHQKLNSGNKGYPVWEWKSTTTVYKLIENLQLIQKDISNK